MIKVENVKNEMYNYYVIYWNDKELLRFVESSTHKNQWDYYSEEMKVEDGNIIADGYDDALEYFKDIIIEHCLNRQVEYESIISELEDSIYD